MGLISFIGSKLLAIGCFFGCVLFATYGLPLYFSTTTGIPTELPPLSTNTILGGISLIIAFISFLASLYYFTHE